MSRTNFDFMFQVPAPVGERSCFNAPRIDEPRPGFGDHLSQASATTLDDTGTAGGSGGQPSTSESSSSDCDSSSTEAPPNETARATESVAGDREDSDGDESQNADVGETSQVTNSDSTPAPVTSEGDDGEQDADEEDVQSDDAFIVVAETVNNGQAVIAANAELPKSMISEDATCKVESSGVAVQDAPSDGGAEAKRAPANLPAAEAQWNEAAVTAPDAVKTPTAPGEPVSETASSKITKLRPAKPKSTTETKQQDQDGARLGDQVEGPEQGRDALSLRVAEKTETKAPSDDRTLSEPTQSERDASSDEGRDANAGSSTRQRSDASSLVNKVSAAAVANGVATQPMSGTPPRDDADNSVRESKATAAKSDVVGDGPRLHGNAASSKRGSPIYGTDEMPRVDPARFVGRVAKAFHTAQERGGTLQIRLSPPELGAMRLELTVTDGVMTASLETETASARRVLLEHLPALRDRLAEQNIRVERFDVDVRRDGTGGPADPRETQDRQQPRQGHSEQRRRQAAQPPIAETARQIKPTNPARTSNYGINLVA